MREGILINKPYKRLDEKQLRTIHKTTINILEEIGIICYNQEATDLFNKIGCGVKKHNDDAYLIKLKEKLVNEALNKTPKQIILGARDKNKTLILNGDTPRVYFGSGSETNILVEVKKEKFIKKGQPDKEIELPVFVRRRGTVNDLCRAAHLCEYLDSLDYFIRTINIQDDDIPDDIKDVNKFYASLNNTTKHVMAGLTDIAQLDNVIKLAEIIVGSKEELIREPIISFIACIAKSPLQLVDDTTQTMIEIIKQDMPVVISSSPTGGSTAHIEELGIIAQMNAEILAGIVLAQNIKEGAKVIYGSVPKRARMDTLSDMYGAPESNHYNVAGVQLAQFYHLPVYSTAGVADSKVPGIQATIEKLLSYPIMVQSGAQLIHYSFGLLEETNAFSLEQAFLDNVMINVVKLLFKEPKIDDENIKGTVDIINKVMATEHKLFAKYARKSIHKGEIFLSYPFKQKEDEDITILEANRCVEEILREEPEYLSKDITSKIYKEVPGLLERINPYNGDIN